MPDTMPEDDGPLLTDLPERVHVLEELPDRDSRLIYQPAADGDGFTMLPDFVAQRARHEADMAPILARLAETKAELERLQRENRDHVIDRAVAEAVERAGVPQQVAKAVQAFVRQEVRLRVTDDNRVEVDDEGTYCDLDFWIGDWLETPEGKHYGPHGRFGTPMPADGPLARALRDRLGN